MQSSSPTLLGLPSELRLNIYDHVFQQALNIKPLDGIKIERHYPPRPNGLQGSFVRARDIRTQPANNSITWLNLTLSCKAISDEIQEYMKSLRYLENDENRTFEMDLQPATQQSEAGNLIILSWRRIPCPPLLAKKLIIHNNGAAIALMPALNLFLHCGVSMDRKSPLQHHLVLDELKVNILSTRALAVPAQTSGLPPVNEQAGGRLEFVHAQATLLNYHRAGKFGGYLGKVCVNGEDGQLYEFSVTENFKAGYDTFRWGV